MRRVTARLMTLKNVVSFIAAIGSSVALSLGLVSLMSLYFHGRVTREFLVTGFLASFVTSAAVLSLALYFVRRLQLAQLALTRSHDELESRVLERTQQLQYVNDALRSEILQREKVLQESVILQERIQQSQKMEAVGLLAGGVAHDFNNIICVISLNTALALDDLPEESEMWSIMTDIATASQRATTLVKQLLVFSKQQLNEPKTVALNLLVQDLVAMLQRLISADIILECASADDLWMVHVDANQIEQVIINLVNNARDAMPVGGTILIETKNVLRRGLDPQDEEAEAFVRLSVRDSGTGMSDELIARIFEPFFTTKSSTGGTGLGLAMVKGIVEQNNGLLEVASTPDEGTCFQIFFHREASELAPTQPLELPVRPDRALLHATLLVVDDNVLLRKQIAMIVRKLGCSVLIASSGSEALELAARHQGTIELLLTDIVMPHMDGPELMCQLRVSRPETAVLFISGYDLGLMATGDVLDTDVGFLAKPFTRAQLTEKIRDVLPVKS